MFNLSMSLSSDSVCCSFLSIWDTKFCSWFGGFQVWSFFIILNLSFIKIIVIVALTLRWSLPEMNWFSTATSLSIFCIFGLLWCSRFLPSELFWSTYFSRVGNWAVFLPSQSFPYFRKCSKLCQLCNFSVSIWLISD